MQLDERKWKILQAIIKTYLETGEPVGSRTISKYADLNLSSATIRNEMADLEELGYIIQPHTSAGRIPSDLGYRLYVNHLMEEKEQQVTEMKELMIEKQDKMEMVLKRVAQFLAANTNYASMITGPQYHRTKLKFIQLSIVSEDQLLAVVVTEGNVVKNKMISLHHGLDQETVLKLNILLNTSLNGLTMDQINLTTIAKIKEEAGIHSEVVNSVLDAVAEAIQMDEEEMEIYTSGATNIFKYPELSDSEKASSLIGTFEEKKQLADLVADTMADDKNTGIQVYIGNETPVQTMKDCSVVTATYELGDGMRGTIGIIGPKRMDYDRVVGTLKTLTTQLDDIFGKKKEKKDKKDEQIEELTDRLKRQMAEFDNFRKRTEKEKAAMFEVGAKSVIEKMLPVIDNFERGLATLSDEEKEQPFAQGMDKIYKQFVASLEELGVKAIEAEGNEFDPNFHNAVMHVEDEQYGENVVAEELQKGYMYRDSVVRHSMVKVAN